MPKAQLSDSRGTRCFAGPTLRKRVGAPPLAAPPWRATLNHASFHDIFCEAAGSLRQAYCRFSLRLPAPQREGFGFVGSHGSVRASLLFSWGLAALRVLFVVLTVTYHVMCMQKAAGSAAVARLEGCLTDGPTNLQDCI